MAKGLASGPITAGHLLMALGTGDRLATKVLKRLGILPSAPLQPLSSPSPPEVELYNEDFDADFRRDFPRLAIAEAESMGWTYLGTDCLLLLLARIGISGVDLPYDRIREVLRELNGPG